MALRLLLAARDASPVPVTASAGSSFQGLHRLPEHFQTFLPSLVKPVSCLQKLPHTCLSSKTFFMLFLLPVLLQGSFSGSGQCLLTSVSGWPCCRGLSSLSRSPSFLELDSPYISQPHPPQTLIFPLQLIRTTRPGLVYPSLLVTTCHREISHGWLADVTAGLRLSPTPARPHSCDVPITECLKTCHMSFTSFYFFKVKGKFH